MGLATEPTRELYSKIEVLQDLEEKVQELMEIHERKRELWFPEDLLGPAPDECPDTHLAKLREQAAGIPDHARAALALNLLTEEGLPHFHRLLAVYLGDESFWRSWNNLWTAEEDRHGQVLHDYTRDTRLLKQRRLEEMQFEYLRAGFHPAWDRDPYRVFAYTTVQERATQFSHSETGKIVAEYEPRLGVILSQVAKEEARHYTFYRTVFEEILKRDPDQALHSASFILPAIDMPGVTMPGFKQIRYWKIESLEGLGELGRKAQEKILGIPARLKRIADHMETKSKGKTFSFEVVFNREFAME